MVRVIEKASTKQCTCYQCKCKLEYEFNDMHFRMESDYGGGRDRVAKIVCPNCQYQTSVPTTF